MGRQHFSPCTRCLPSVAISHALSPPKGWVLVRLQRCLWRLLVGAVCVLYLGVTLQPLSDIHKSPAIPFRKESERLHQLLGPFHASTSYGLFRRMTGTGSVPNNAKGPTNQWGGLPPSIVEVPAVVVEGSSDGKTWHEIPFRYAPYKPERPPRRTAPHQPRLDWQMWFAALGDYRSNPWFVHLMWKLLVGSPDVIELLDHDEYPFKDHPPRAVRASLYHYDFTRIQSPWAERQPRGSLAKIINCTRGSAEHSLWWNRKRVDEYFPAVDKGSLQEIQKEQGWASTPLVPASQRLQACDKRRKKLAKEPMDRMGEIVSEAVTKACDAVILVRRHGASVRNFVGWKFEFPMVGLFWSGVSTECFLDGPLLAISVAVAAPLLLRFILSCLLKLFLHIFGRSRRKSAKQKVE